MTDQEITSLYSNCPGGTSLECYLIQIVRELENDVNLATFLHRLAKLYKMKSISGNREYLYENIFQILIQDLGIISNQDWSDQNIGNALYGLQNSSNVPTELFLAFANVIPKIQNWDSQGIGSALYGLQNSSNVPTELFLAFANVIPKVQNWDAQSIGNALYGIGNLGSEVDSIIRILIDKTQALDLNSTPFMNLQALIIGMNIAGVDIPENINTKWNEYVHNAGTLYSKRTGHEGKIFHEIIEGFKGDGYTVYSGIFLQGFEVDIVILDTNNKIFAIIESDGILHENSIRQMRDNRRDQYFLEVGVTDLIIRVSQNGCKILGTY